MPGGEGKGGEGRGGEGINYCDKLYAALGVAGS